MATGTSTPTITRRGMITIIRIPILTNTAGQ
jgi:hypothetical protein